MCSPQLRLIERSTKEMATLITVLLPNISPCDREKTFLGKKNITEMYY